MKTTSLKFLCVFFISISANAQTDKALPEFQRTYGGMKKDNSYHVMETADKGFLSIGSTESFGAGKSDIYLIKMDSLGNMEWAKAYGGPENDYGHYMDKTKDGNYIILGHSASYAAQFTDICIMKIDIKGNIIWSKSFGMDKSEYANSIKTTADGGFIILGETINFIGSDKNSDIILIKTDSKGDFEWSKIFGGKSTDYGYSVEQTKEGGYIIGGETNSFGAGEWDFYLVKISKEGNFEWGKTYGEALSDYGRFAMCTSDGGYIIGGNTVNFKSSEFDFVVAKVDKNGEPLWAKMYGGTATDYLLSMKMLPDDGFVVCGYTNSFDLPAEDAFITIFNSNGRSIWGKTYGGKLNDYGVSFSFGSNGSIIMGGSSNSFGAQEEDVYIVKTYLKRTSNDCNSHPVNPLITTSIKLKVSSGGHEYDIHAMESPINLTITPTLTAEQILCIEEED
jgi:hypothetical protein